MIQEILYLLAGLIVLIGGGELLVRGASTIALRLEISPLVIGLTVVAFGTSCPELFISLHSALDGSPDMSVGNVIGSNICNLALVLGITTIISPININVDTLRIDWPMAMGSSLLMYILVYEGWLERHEGIIFVMLLGAYIVFLIRKAKKDGASAVDIDEIGALESETKAMHWVKDIAFLVLGCVGLYFGSEMFVGGAKDIFLDLGVSERVIGIFVLAIGTSLPELVTSIVAALKKNTDLAIGNLIGSNIFNVLSILGITSIIQDIHVSGDIKNYDILWMLGVTLVILPMMIANRKMGRVQGIALLAIYFYYTYSIFS